jgi:hypothetical protein
MAWFTPCLRFDCAFHSRSAAVVPAQAAGRHAWFCQLQVTVGEACTGGCWFKTHCSPLKGLFYASFECATRHALW